MTTLHQHAARDHCLAGERRIDAPLGGSRYGRLFPDLEVQRVDEGVVRRLGAAGGACDARVTPVEERRDDAPGIAAGWPFFGQFVAHDITADRSLLSSHVDPEALRNARTPRIDLECL